MSGPSNLLLEKIKLTVAFNIRVLVFKSRDSSPLRRSLTIEASREVKLFSFIVETMFSRIDLSFVNLGQWSK